MMRFRFGSNHDEKRFVEYCRYAYIQLEMLVNMIVEKNHLLRNEANLNPLIDFFILRHQVYQIAVYNSVTKKNDRWLILDYNDKKIYDNKINFERAPKLSYAQASDKLNTFYRFIVIGFSDLLFEVKKLAKIRNVMSHQGNIVEANFVAMDKIFKFRNLNTEEQKLEANHTLRNYYYENDHYLYIHNIDYVWVDNFIIPLYQYYSKSKDYF